MYMLKPLVSRRKSQKIQCINVFSTFLHTFKSLIHAKQGLQLVMLKGAINDQDRDYQKGKDTTNII